MTICMFSIKKWLPLFINQPRSTNFLINFTEYLCHVFVRNDSLAGVVVADKEYPSRVAFTLLGKVCHNNVLIIHLYKSFDLVVF